MLLRYTEVTRRDQYESDPSMFPGRFEVNFGSDNIINEVDFETSGKHHVKFVSLSYDPCTPEHSLVKKKSKILPVYSLVQ